MLYFLYTIQNWSCLQVWIIRIKNAKISINAYLILWFKPKTLSCNWKWELLLKFMQNHSFLAGRWSINIKANTRHDDDKSKKRKFSFRSLTFNSKRNPICHCSLLHLFRRNLDVKEDNEKSKIFNKFLHSKITHIQIRYFKKKYRVLKTKTAWDKSFDYKWFNKTLKETWLPLSSRGEKTYLLWIW